MATKAELDLGLAITAVLEERGFLREGMALGDYLVMLEMTGWTDELAGKTNYVNIIPGDHGLPLHRVAGLISVCGDMLGDEDE